MPTSTHVDLIAVADTCQKLKDRILETDDGSRKTQRYSK